MTSQILAIFYLSDLDRYIVEKLKFTSYIRYQDDGLIFSDSKKELVELLGKIKKFLQKENLSLNPKTRIYTNSENYIFLGITKKFVYSKKRQITRKIKGRKYLYYINRININSFVNSHIYYDYLKMKKGEKEKRKLKLNSGVENIVDKVKILHPFCAIFIKKDKKMYIYGKDTEMIM